MLLFIVSSCSSINVKDTKVCAVSGVITAGANCVYTVSKKREQLNLEQLIEMLEPNVKEKRGGAIIIPFKDYIDVKENIEIVCNLKMVKCKKDILDNLESVHVE